MKIRVKPTIDTARKLLRDNIPTEVIDQILGRTITVEADQPYTIHAMFAGSVTAWEVAPDCVEILPSEH
jgi:hypothetical protein